MKINNLLKLFFLFEVIFSCQKSRYSQERGYYSSGIIEYDVAYLDDTILNGYARYYYPTGKLSKTCFYQNGLLEGLQKSYNMDGKLIEAIPFKNGKMNGVAKWFYSSGKIKEISNWQMGFQFGNSFFFYKNGKLKGYNCYDFNSENIYALKFDSISGKILMEKGYSFSRKFYSVNGSRNTIINPGFEDIFIAVPAPPLRKIKLRMGKIEINKEGMFEKLSKLTTNNNVALYNCYLSSGNNKLVTIAEVLKFNGDTLKIDTVYTEIMVGK